MTRRIVPHAPSANFGATVLAVGEVLFDETNLTLVVGDGITPGGLPLTRLKVSGTTGDGVVNDTIALQALFDTAGAIYTATGRLVVVDLLGLKYKITTLNLRSGIILRNAIFVPASQSTGNVVGMGVTNVTVENCTFLQTKQSNYNPALQFHTFPSNIVIRRNRFLGCGFGCSVLQATNLYFGENVLRDIGICPRPAPLDAGDAGFGPNFEVYGGGFRAVLSNGVTVHNNDFRNVEPAGGAYYDQRGGPGGMTCYVCNNVLFLGGTTINAPGHGMHCAGEWQGVNVVYPMSQYLNGAGTFDFTKNGRNIRFIGCYCEGSNQEGITAFGCGEVSIVGCDSRNNRYASFEVWQCWNASIQDSKGYEAPNADHPLYVPPNSTPSGSATFHIVGVHGAVVTGNICRTGRYNGMLVAGSHSVVVADNVIKDYGAADDALPYMASGICLNIYFGEPDHQAMSTEITIANNQFNRKTRTVNSGGDIFAQTAATLYAYGNTAVGRDVTYSNDPSGFVGIPKPYVQSKGVSFGGSIFSPDARIGLSSRVANVTTSALTIFTTSNLTPGQHDAYLILVNGCDNGNGDAIFSDLILMVHNGAPVVVGAANLNTVAARTYSQSGGNLQLAMASGTYSIRASSFQVRSGSPFI